MKDDGAIMPLKTYVDFSRVLPEHRAIDERLENWGRWNYSCGSGSVSPMFRLYRAPEHWQQAFASRPVDQMDARRIQWAMQYLGVRIRLALAWAYIYGFVSPAKTARKMEIDMQELADLVEAGRQALVDRRV